MTKPSERKTINLSLRRDLLAEIDRAATLADEYRYETIERFLEIALRLEEKGGFSQVE